MGARGKAYVDTSALIAFLDRSDTYHATFTRLFSDPPPLVTTPLVVGEGHAWFLRRYDRTRALQFLSMIEDMKPLAILALGAKETVAATKLLQQFSDQDLTLTDALGLHVMDVGGIRRCWSTDAHLGITGVPLVIHER